MLEEIKAYWYNLKTEYENKYGDTFLSDFNQSKKYLEQMQSYLQSKLEECPSNVDAVCTLASVMLELRDGEAEYVEFLENFLDKFDNALDDKDKARIYTNIAFAEDYSRKSLEYLTQAEELKSPFAETYTALGLYYFSEYEFYRNQKNISISNEYFKMARDIDESYECSLNYAVSLYELKEYEKAKNLFLDLLSLYSDRMWLKLCIAYCEVHLGNKEEAISYLEQVKSGQDDNNYLSTDDIAEYQIFDAYYALEEYDIFLSYCDEEVDDSCYTADWAHLFYALWLKGKMERFVKLEDKNRTYLDEAIKEAMADENYDSEEEKQETIASWKEDKVKFEEMLSRIKEHNSRPAMELKLYPEYSCFMVDCVRHRLLKNERTGIINYFMKKLYVIANIFFVLSLILMLLVILQNLNLIHIMPITRLEELERFLHYGLIANCIAYISLLISIIMRVINFKINKTRNKNNCKSANTNKRLRILKLLFKILLIIFTFIIVGISLLFTFLALIEIPDIPA